MRAFLSFLGCTCVLSVAACSGSSSGNAPGDGGIDGADAAAGDGSGGDAAPAEAGGDGGGSSDAAADAGACNTLVNSAQSVMVQQVAMDPPSPAGGTILDGTYDLTAVAIYTGPNGPSGPSGSSQTTISISGATIQVVTSGQPDRQTVTLATQGSAFTATDTCPDNKVTMGSYSASGTTFTIFLDGGTDDAGNRTVVETFTKQ
jgi:hypothetical protein